MLRFILIFILLLVGAAAYIFYSAGSLPEWYEDEAVREQATFDRLGRQIEQQGAARFLGDKFADVLRGNVVLNEDEFNGILLASLANSKDGRRLLTVSDVVRADLRDGELEIGAIINLNKVSGAEPKVRKAFDEALRILPFDPGEKIFVALRGKPVARSGNLGLQESVDLQIGALPISGRLLKSAGVPVERLAQESLPLQLLDIRSVDVRNGEIEFGVRAKF